MAILIRLTFKTLTQKLNLISFLKLAIRLQQIVFYTWRFGDEKWNVVSGEMRATFIHD